MPADSEVDDFLEDVDDVVRLVEGLKAGTISPEYVDSKLEQKQQKGSFPLKSDGSKDLTPKQPARDTCKQDEAKQKELLRKVAELKANRERKLTARQQYEEYLKNTPQAAGTDYAKWDLWCPSDEEDDLFNSIAPNTPEFRAMEADINNRHHRMVEQRQIAERRRVQGNAAYKQGQHSEALRCYEGGLEAQRQDMALHANAAMAAIKLKCYVQALEHCNKVLHIAEVLHNRPADPLCVKSLQRRATVHQALDQPRQAVADLEAALVLKPGDAEIETQLATARRLLEDRKQRKKLNTMVQGSQGVTAGDTSVDVLQLKQIEQLVQQLAGSCPGALMADDRADLVKACDALTGLIQGNEPCSIYFRQCGGLEAARQLVVKGYVEAVLKVLEAACSSNDITLQQLLETSPTLLQQVLDLITGDASAPSTRAALDLLFTVSTAACGRQQLCQCLQGGAGGQVLAVLSKLPALEPPSQVLLLQVLANCMTSVKLQACTAQALQQSPDHPSWAHLFTALTGGSLHQQPTGSSSDNSSNRVHTEDVGNNHATTSTSSSSSSWKRPRSKPITAAATTTTEPLLRLMCNMCGNKQLRQMLAAQPDLVQQLTGLVACRSIGHETRVQALSCLCNLLLEPEAAATAAAAPDLKGLLQMGCSRAIPNVRISSSSSGGSSQAKGADVSQQQNGGASRRVTGLGGVQLPTRRPSVANEGSSECAGRQSIALAGKALVVLSRIVRVESGIQQLLDMDADVVLVHALQEYLKNWEPEMSGDDIGRKLGCSRTPDGAVVVTEGSGVAGDGREWLDAAVRCICALLSESVKRCNNRSSSSRTQLPEAAAEVLLEAMADGRAGDTVVGNAALGLGHLANCMGLEHVFQKGHAVRMLVNVMRKGEGNASSRNAAITLAKLARDPHMLEQLRELRGLEIMYKYIKP